MPFNVKLGDTVAITVTFFASSAPQVVTVPSSATLTIVYPNSSAPLTTTTSVIGMTLVGDFFQATWASGVAYYGLTSISAAPATGTAVSDTLRVTS